MLPILALGTDTCKGNWIIGLVTTTFKFSILKFLRLYKEIPYYNKKCFCPHSKPEHGLSIIAGSEYKHHSLCQRLKDQNNIGILSVHERGCCVRAFCIAMSVLP
jgi:hypothetical protein